MLLRTVAAALVGWTLVAGLCAESAAEEKKPDFTRQEDIVYGRKDGMALTLDVFTPKKANGAAVIWVVSGGWFSSHPGAGAGKHLAVFLDRGYTTFAVVHGSQPRYTIPDAIADLNRAVRYIRAHAQDFHIDPQRIGIYGGSAGGHLSLMQGTAADLGNPKSPDPIGRASSRVQAVACFYPPTDFLNYGEPGNEALGTGILVNFRAPFEFRRLDPKTRCFAPITDAEEIRQIGRQISPVTHVSKDDPPTLIIHGDADKLVPIQQSQLMMERFKQAGVPAELVVKPGAAHGWKDGIMDDMAKIVGWFDKHLAAPKP